MARMKAMNEGNRVYGEGKEWEEVKDVMKEVKDGGSDKMKDGM